MIVRRHYPRLRVRFVARTTGSERPLTGTRVLTCRPWGWFSMDPRGEHGLYPQEKGGKKSASRGEVMEPTYSLGETPRLGAIEVLSDKARYSKHRGRW